MRKWVFFLNLIIVLNGCKTGRQDISKNHEGFPPELYDSVSHKILFSDNNDRLIHFIINKPSVKYCAENHRHFVDIVARDKIDSLNKVGVKNILFYRDWIGTNGFNGYGKLIWIQKDKCYQYQLNFENYDGRYGISSIDKSELKNCEAFDLYVEKRIDTVRSSPKEPEFWMSHAANHFVYANINGNENCFDISGHNLMEDSTHLKSQMINKLKIPSGKYFSMLETRRKRN